MKNKIQDLIIIGAGPIGLACGIEAQKKDLDHLIFDKRLFGQFSLSLSDEYDFFLNFRQAGNRRRPFYLS